MNEYLTGILKRAGYDVEPQDRLPGMVGRALPQEVTVPKSLAKQLRKQDEGITPTDLAYRGLAAFVGGIPDIATAVMRPFGYSVPDRQVVGSSEWIGKQMEDAGLVSTARAPWQELAASMVSPSGLAKGLAVGLPAIAGTFVGKGSKTWDAIAASKAQEAKKALTESDYYYHGTPKANIESIEKSGLNTGLSGRVGFTSAGPDEAKKWASFMQGSKAEDTAIVRVKKTDIKPDLVDGEEVFVGSGVPRSVGVPKEVIEISTDGGKTWSAPSGIHPVASIGDFRGSK